MKVILTEDVPNLGEASKLVNVKDGYARNFLIPNGLAIQATTQNVKSLEHHKRLVQSKLQKAQRAAETLAKKIEAVSCTVTKVVGEEDKIFGSVTSADIQTSLKNEGIELEKKQILLDEPLKNLGIFTVPVRVHPEVTANVKVWVVKE